MRVRFTKRGGKADLLTCIRADGSETNGDLPKQGVLPHDAIHYVAETVLGWRQGFFGQIRQGSSLDFATARLHEEKSAWSQRTQAIQSEALVECLETELWGGGSEAKVFLQNLADACAQRRVAAPTDITPERLEELRTQLRAFGAQWRPLAIGESIERSF